MILFVILDQRKLLAMPLRLPKFLIMPVHKTFFKGTALPYFTFIGLQVLALEFVYSPMVEGMLHFIVLRLQGRI